MLLVLGLVPALKQRLNKLINGSSQTNIDQKLNLINLKYYDSNVKNRQKPLQMDLYLLHWIHYN